jgi:hypothetical protein
MATAILDTLGEVSCEEEDGVVTALTREVTVKDMTTGPGVDSIEWIAEALNASGMPTVNSYHNTYPNLRVCKRSVRQAGNGDHGVAIVTLTYKQYGRNDRLNFVPRGGTGLTQIQTLVDAFGNPLTVAHTFPLDDIDEQYRGATLSHVADVSVMEPQPTLEFEGMIQSTYPLSITNAFAGRVNSAYWAGGAPGCWLCTRVDFTPMQVLAIPRLWSFVFEFSGNIHGWQPPVHLIDHRSGRAPINLVPGVGGYTATWYPSMNFNWYFPN